MANHPGGFVPRPAPFPPLSLFDKSQTVGNALKENPSWAPKKAAARLYPKPWFGARFWRRITIKRDLLDGRVWTPEELDEAAARGSFPHRPSDLFLNIYADVLTCLTRDPLAGNVSPPLIGTSGTIPLSIVSTIPDIMHHYRDCIVLAEREVFLVTNYWQPSNSVSAVADALIELDRRIGKRAGKKVVVKIMWDRGAWEQLVHNHASVNEKIWVPLGLPAQATVPNLSLQVINFHRPLLGTFHQKALVIDRKVALLNSNNIQDRPNIEMMVHLEGPVVDSVYDVLLLSWHEAFSPPLACAGLPTRYPTESTHEYHFADENPYLSEIDVAKAAKVARKLLALQNKRTEDLRAGHTDRSWWRRSAAGETLHEDEEDGEDGVGRRHPPPVRRGSGGFAGLVSQLVDRAREERAKMGAGPAATGAPTEQPIAEKLESSPPGLGAEQRIVTEAATGSSGSPASTAGEKHDEEKTIAGTEEKPSLSPDPLAEPLPQTTSPSADVKIVENEMSKEHEEQVAKELEHAKLGSKESTGSFTDLRFSKLSATSSRLKALSGALNAGALSQADATIDDESLIDDFAPHLLHHAHKPFPMAMVNRRPHGMPGHQDVRVPQNAAWLGGLRYAQRDVFIQTPTLNAAPVVKAILEACKFGGPKKTGIEVTLFLDLGFNDKGESVPFQGGTNEEVVFRLFKDLTRNKKEQNLHVYWYTGKDQSKPVNAVHKTRNCHVKFMSIDGQCGIVGNGNQDTQSWFHSQECNILIDDPTIVADWMRQLKTNQSTHAYGRVDTDGIWRDPKTNEALQAPKSVSCFSAMWAMI